MSDAAAVFRWLRVDGVRSCRSERVLPFERCESALVSSHDAATAPPEMIISPLGPAREACGGCWIVAIGMYIGVSGICSDAKSRWVLLLRSRESAPNNKEPSYILLALPHGPRRPEGPHGPVPHARAHAPHVDRKADALNSSPSGRRRRGPRRLHRRGHASSSASDSSPRAAGRRWGGRRRGGRRRGRAPHEKPQPFAGSHGSDGSPGPRRAAAAAAACPRLAAAARLLNDPRPAAAAGAGAGRVVVVVVVVDGLRLLSNVRSPGSAWPWPTPAACTRSAPGLLKCLRLLLGRRRGLGVRRRRRQRLGAPTRAAPAAARRRPTDGPRRPSSGSAACPRRCPSRRRSSSTGRAAAARRGRVREAAALRRRRLGIPARPRLDRRRLRGQRRSRRRLGLDDVVVVVIIVVARALLAPQDPQVRLLPPVGAVADQFPDALRVERLVGVGALAPARRLRVRRRQPRRALGGMWRLIVVGLVT